MSMMSRKVRKMLDRIDAVLAQPDDATDEQRKDSHDLWAVLSALRGPDAVGNERLKDRTTILIRRAAFPLTASTGNGTPQAVFDSQAANAVHLDTRIMAAELNSNERVGLVHFVDHAKLAGRALGLLALDPWSYLNKVVGIPQKVVPGADQS